MARALAIPPRSFEHLVRAVRTALKEGQATADRAYLKTYHRTGELIHAHWLANKDRADYGAKLVPRLAAALQIHERLIYRCLRFYRCFPILALRSELAWTHYRVLIDVVDESQRKDLTKEAARKGWTVAQLEERVRALNAINVTPTLEPAKPPVPPRLLTPKRGTPGVCRVIAVEGAPVVDLGFAVYRDLPTALHKAGDFVRVDAAGRVTAVPDATKADLFTYHAEVLKVVDGDTLWVKVYLEPERWVKQKLRLRDLDCSEIDTAEGKAAKRFVEALVGKAESVTICTTRPDKYDRYLADVFLSLPDGEEYLNNALLTHGHAVRKSDYSPSDWDDK